MPVPRTIARLNRYVTNPLLRRIAGFMPGFGIVHHVGRKSGRPYAIPVNVFRQGGTWIIALTYGAESDWVKNVLAAGGCTLETRGAIVHLLDPVIEIDQQKDWAPLPIRLILRALGVDEAMRLRENPPDLQNTLPL